MLTPNTAWWDNPEKYCFHFKDKDELARKLMVRSPPTILPLALWERIHYKLNGMYDRDIFNMTGKFAEELRRHGIEGTVSDFFAILALSTGIDIKELKEKSEKSLMTGDIEVLEDIVRTINSSVKRKEE